MKNFKKTYRNFLPDQKKLEELEKNLRFKRIYSEYESMKDELWDLENNESQDITDDFLDAIQMQAFYLENEIKEWIKKSAQVV